MISNYISAGFHMTSLFFIIRNFQSQKLLELLQDKAISLHLSSLKQESVTLILQQIQAFSPRNQVAQQPLTH